MEILVQVLVCACRVGCPDGLPLSREAMMLFFR